MQGSSGQEGGAGEVPEAARTGLVVSFSGEASLIRMAGKTVEAKTDLARLQEVRARRDAAAAQRKAEADGVWLGLASEGAKLT